MVLGLKNGDLFLVYFEKKTGMTPSVRFDSSLLEEYGFGVCQLGIFLLCPIKLSIVKIMKTLWTTLQEINYI